MTDRFTTDQGDAASGGPHGGGVDRDELLQLAELEARGLIEPAEELRLERLFAAASPSLQAEVRSMQERLALEPTLRSDEMPGESLRLRTLGRVAHAIEQEAAGAAPIAMIGPRLLHSKTDGVKEGLRIDGAKIESGKTDGARREQMSLDAVRSIIDGITRERERLQIVRQPYWRAAAFFLLAALCVSVYFNWRYVAVSEKLAGFANAAIIDADMRMIASTMAGFDFGAARHLDLKRIQGAQKAHVEIFTDPNSGRVAVLGVGFDVGETLEIVIRDPEGGAPHIQQFRVDAMGFGKVCEVPAEFARAGLVEVRNGAGATLFTA